MIKKKHQKNKDGLLKGMTKEKEEDQDEEKRDFEEMAFGGPKEKTKHPPPPKKKGLKTPFCILNNNPLVLVIYVPVAPCPFF